MRWWRAIWRSSSRKGRAARCLSPDVSVALDAGRHDRGSYKLWEEPGVPDLALEALSEKSWRRDVEVKPPLYEALGVREYWILDPIGKLPEPIVGYRLHHGRYRRIPANRSGGWFSDVFGADLLIHEGEFRFRDVKTGELVPDYDEAERRIAEADRRIAGVGSGAPATSGLITRHWPCNRSRFLRCSPAPSA